MIRASVSEVKNRLSHFLRLVRGGEEVEIMDRATPVARIIHVAKAPNADKDDAWIAELVSQGIVTPPKQKREFRPEFFDKESMPKGTGVLQALLEDRQEGWR